MASQLVLECSEALARKHWKITFAESVTAGRMSYEFSTTPQSGKVLLGGIVCYDASVKEGLLHVPHGLIKEFTPESAEVTKEIAIGFYPMTMPKSALA